MSDDVQMQMWDPGPDEPIGTRYCVRCGSPVNSGWDFCPKCGSAVVKAAAVKETPSQPVQAEKSVPAPPVQAARPAPAKNNHRSAFSVISFAIAALVLAAVISLAFPAGGNRSGAVSPTPKAATPTPKAAAPSPKPVSVPNGMRFKYPTYEGVCPLTIHVPSGDEDYFIYLRYLRAPSSSTVSREKRQGLSYTEDDLAFYVKAGKSVDIDVPIGVYKMSFSCGETWYGYEKQFGPYTGYYESEGTLSFYADNEAYNGHTISLWLSAAGNLDRTKISADQFPA